MTTAAVLCSLGVTGRIACCPIRIRLKDPLCDDKLMSVAFQCVTSLLHKINNMMTKETSFPSNAVKMRRLKQASSEEISLRDNVLLFQLV